LNRVIGIVTPSAKAQALEKSGAAKAVKTDTCGVSAGGADHHVVEQFDVDGS